MWFYWAAVFAIASMVLQSSGRWWAGALGLGVLHAPFIAHLAGAERVVAIAMPVIVLALFGWFAGLGEMWAFGLGMLAYAADAVMLALDAQWFAAGVHVVILCFIYGGLTAAGMAHENERLARDMTIRAALAKDRAARPAIPEEPVTPAASDPLAAPQAFRPGVSPPPAEEE